MRPFMERKKRESLRTAGAHSGRSEIDFRPGHADDLSVVTRVRIGAEGVPEEVECAVMDATLVKWRIGPTRIVASALVSLIQAGRVFHCVFPTATGFALGPRLLAVRSNGDDVLVLDGRSAQEWVWGNMAQMAASLKD